MTNTHYTNLISKGYSHGFLHCRAQRKSKRPYCMGLSAWIHTSRHAHLQVGLISAGHVCLYHTFSRELVFEPQLDQKKISASGFLHCRAQSESDSKGPFPLNLGP